MLKNKKIVYFCQECGYESAKWMGQCPGCKAWNSFVEEPVSTVKKSAAGGKASIRQQSEPVILKDISLKLYCNLRILRSFYAKAHLASVLCKTKYSGARYRLIYEHAVALQLGDLLECFYFIHISLMRIIRDL